MPESGDGKVVWFPPDDAELVGKARATGAISAAGSPREKKKRYIEYKTSEGVFSYRNLAAKAVWTLPDGAHLEVGLRTLDILELKPFLILNFIEWIEC